MIIKEYYVINLSMCHWVWDCHCHWRWRVLGQLINDRVESTGARPEPEPGRQSQSQWGRARGRARAGARGHGITSDVSILTKPKTLRHLCCSSRIHQNNVGKCQRQTSTNYEDNWHSQRHIPLRWSFGLFSPTPAARISQCRGCKVHGRLGVFGIFHCIYRQDRT